MSIVTDTRDQVAQAIRDAMDGANAALSPKVTVTAAYDLYWNLDQLSAGQILVIPTAKDCEPLTRKGQRERTITIEIAVQFKWGDTGPTLEALDPYQSLAEAIADYFERRKLTNGATCIHVDHPRLFVDEHLRKLRTYTSVLALTLLVIQ